MRMTVTTYSDVERSGHYICGTCGDYSLPLYKGEEAPQCANCHRPVTWLWHRQLGRQPIGFVIQS
jgi:hypothetical protein